MTEAVVVGGVWRGRVVATAFGPRLADGGRGLGGGVPGRRPGVDGAAAD
jgi:hypothetical protein